MFVTGRSLRPSVGKAGASLSEEALFQPEVLYNYIYRTIILNIEYSASSSRGISPSALHSYSKRRFIRPPVSPSLRQWGACFLFLR